jgi:hypothetical protein
MGIMMLVMDQDLSMPLIELLIFVNILSDLTIFYIL